LCQERVSDAEQINEAEAGLHWHCFTDSL